jgi:hypothetical protein
MNLTFCNFTSGGVIQTNTFFANLAEDCEIKLQSNTNSNQIHYRDVQNTFISFKNKVY